MREAIRWILGAIGVFILWNLPATSGEENLAIAIPAAIIISSLISGAAGAIGSKVGADAAKPDKIDPNDQFVSGALPGTDPLLAGTSANLLRQQGIFNPSVAQGGSPLNQAFNRINSIPSLTVGEKKNLISNLQRIMQGEDPKRIKRSNNGGDEDSGGFFGDDGVVDKIGDFAKNLNFGG